MSIWFDKLHHQIIIEWCLQSKMTTLYYAFVLRWYLYHAICTLESDDQGVLLTQQPNHCIQDVSNHRGVLHFWQHFLISSVSNEDHCLQLGQCLHQLHHSALGVLRAVCYLQGSGVWIKFFSVKLMIRCVTVIATKCDILAVNKYACSLLFTNWW